MTSAFQSKLLPKTIAHGFFTRDGGVSEGLYASLNTGYGSGDDKKKVLENRKRVLSALGSQQEDLITCYQIHSNKVHIISERIIDITHEADALVTTIPHLAIGVLTADCVPVLFADPEARVIAAAHAGWKGTHAGILQETIAAMEVVGAKRSHIIAAIGPCIAQNSYEVGQDVWDAFREKDHAFSRFFKAHGVNQRYFFDMGGVANDILTRQGIAKLEKLDYDTYTNESQFFSFRRSTHKKEPVYGRQISAIMLKE